MTEEEKNLEIIQQKTHYIMKVLDGCERNNAITAVMQAFCYLVTNFVDEGGMEKGDMNKLFDYMRDVTESYFNENTKGTIQ